MKITLITIRLELTTPGGVAGPEQAREDRNALPLRRTPDGRIHLPGSTVAGSLRAHCAQTTNLDIFGSPPAAEQLTPSEVQILGTVHHPPTTGRTPDIVARTAIDRHRAAARTHTLRTTERLPAGTTFDLMLRWDNPTDTQLATFHTAIRTWQPRLGHAVTTGAGRTSVIGYGTRTLDLATEPGLTAWLALDTADSYPPPTRWAADNPTADLIVDIGFEIVDGLHIGIGDQQEDTEDGPTLARVVRATPQGPPMIPGSSLKGVLRSRADYICRLCDQLYCLDARCGQCRPCHLFGYAGTDRPGDRAKRGALAVLDADIDNAVCEPRQHVALDRFTGGARPTLLYTDEVVVAGTFRLRIEQLQPVDMADRALLHAVIADLHDGLIGLGASTTRGLGTIRVTDHNWRPPDLITLANTLADHP